jgi:diguanylate cyclase (GGDEF)-like protein
MVTNVMDARLQDLLARVTAADPAALAADPLGPLAAHADHLLVIDALERGHRYTHYGAAFTRHFGSDLTGLVIDVLPGDVLPAERRGMLDFEYTFAGRAGRPLWRSYTALFGEALETWQRLVLPLAGGRLLVGAYPVEAAPAADGDAEALLRLVIERVPLVLDETGGIADLALSLKAFCDARQHLAEMEVLATRDPLTGVANSRHFRHLAGLELDHAGRMGRSFSLLALDIDHFKTINDSWGHAAGDEALRSFAEACKLALREYDILGRVGGEEFAVALPNTGTDGARVIAERLRRQVEEMVVRPARGQMFDLTVSIGVASCSGVDLVLGELDIQQILERADAALYKAKQTGRNRVVVGDA